MASSRRRGTRYTRTLSATHTHNGPLIVDIAVASGRSDTMNVRPLSGRAHVGKKRGSSAGVHTAQNLLLREEHLGEEHVYEDFGDDFADTFESVSAHAPPRLQALPQLDFGAVFRNHTPRQVPPPVKVPDGVKNPFALSNQPSNNSLVGSFPRRPTSHRGPTRPWATLSPSTPFKQRPNTARVTHRTNTHALPLKNTEDNQRSEHAKGGHDETTPVQQPQTTRARTLQQSDMAVATEHAASVQPRSVFTRCERATERDTQRRTEKVWREKREIVCACACGCVLCACSETITHAQHKAHLCIFVQMDS